MDTFADAALDFPWLAGGNRHKRRRIADVLEFHPVHYKMKMVIIKQAYMLIKVKNRS